MNSEENTYCYYSDLPSPMAYMLDFELTKPELETRLNDNDQFPLVSLENITNKTDEVESICDDNSNE